MFFTVYKANIAFGILLDNTEILSAKMKLTNPVFTVGSNPLVFYSSISLFSFMQPIFLPVANSLFYYAKDGFAKPPL